jgi:hypothetical protein
VARSGPKVPSAVPIGPGDKSHLHNVRAPAP